MSTTIATAKASDWEPSRQHPLLDDLRSACLGLTPAQWAWLVAACAGNAAATTAGRRATAVVSSVGSATAKAKRYVRLGVRAAAAEDLTSTQHMIEALPSRLTATFEQFRALNRARQVDEVAQLLVTWLAFFAAGGGPDLEGGLPDLDMAIAGMGAHRHVFSHSILLGLGVETSLRFSLAMMDALVDRMPEDRDPVWAKITETSRRYTDRSAAGIWAGIGAHLVNDAGLLGLGATKPVVGLPMHLSMAGHKLFLAANGAAALVAAKPGREPRRMGVIKL
jgi:hypothetical protein